MAEDPIDALQHDADLDDECVDFLRPLSPADVAVLREAFVTTKQRQSEALHDAIDKGLKAVPFLLRKPVQVILFPEGR